MELCNVNPINRKDYSKPLRRNIPLTIYVVNSCSIVTICLIRESGVLRPPAYTLSLRLILSFPFLFPGFHSLSTFEGLGFNVLSIMR
jgi:hypothetical protein